jgi:hypothetical protein
MQVDRSTAIVVKLTSAEVITALKAYYPHDLSIQALPLNPSGRGVHLSAEVPKGTCGLHITFIKETHVPSPAPVVDDEPDPA